MQVGQCYSPVLQNEYVDFKSLLVVPGIGLLVVCGKIFKTQIPDLAYKE